MKSPITIMFCCAILCHGCVPDLRPFQWLVGTWEMPKANGSILLETWEVKDELSLSGKGLKVTGGDTTLTENISLHFEQGDVWYVPAVPDQNNGKPVPFKLVDVKDNQFTFENPDHDFPQRIKYDFKPINGSKPFVPSIGDTLNVAVTDLVGEGIHFRFIRKR